MFVGNIFGSANIFVKLYFSDVKLIGRKNDGTFMIPRYAKKSKIKFTD